MFLSSTLTVLGVIQIMECICTPNINQHGAHLQCMKDHHHLSPVPRYVSLNISSSIDSAGIFS